LSADFGRIIKIDFSDKLQKIKRKIKSESDKLSKNKNGKHQKDVSVC